MTCPFWSHLGNENDMPTNFPPLPGDDLLRAEEIATAFESRDWHEHQRAEEDMQVFHIASRLCAEVRRLRSVLIEITDVEMYELKPVAYVDRVDTIAHKALGGIK